MDYEFFLHSYFRADIKLLGLHAHHVHALQNFFHRSQYLYEPHKVDMCCLENKDIPGLKIPLPSLALTT